MDEQMIAHIAKAIRLGRFERNGRGAAYDPDLPLHETEIADARAAHSVMAGKVAELEGALQDAEPLVETLHSITNAKDTRAIVWRCLKRIRAALAPHPKGME